MPRDRHHSQVVKPLEVGELEYVADNMREADRQELIAAHGQGRSLRSILRLSVISTPEPCSILCPKGTGEPIAILGVAPPALLGGSATPWLLGTDKIFKSPRVFLQGGRSWVSEMVERYGFLENFVDERNTTSKVWLKSIGFTLEEPKPYGVGKLPFHRFTAAKVT